MHIPEIYQWNKSTLEEMYSLIIFLVRKTILILSMPILPYISNHITGVFRPRFCPTTSGCRGLVTFDDDLRNKIIGGSNGKIRISFNNTSGRTIWMVSITFLKLFEVNSRISKDKTLFIDTIQNLEKIYCGQLTPFL